jgi:hypothetical protein
MSEGDLEIVTYECSLLCTGHEQIGIRIEQTSGGKRPKYYIHLQREQFQIEYEYLFF